MTWFSLLRRSKESNQLDHSFKSNFTWNWAFFNSFCLLKISQKRFLTDFSQFLPFNLKFSLFEFSRKKFLKKISNRKIVKNINWNFTFFLIENNFIDSRFTNQIFLIKKFDFAMETTDKSLKNVFLMKGLLNFIKFYILLDKLGMSFWWI